MRDRLRSMVMIGRSMIIIKMMISISFLWAMKVTIYIGSGCWWFIHWIRTLETQNVALEEFPICWDCYTLLFRFDELSDHGYNPLPKRITILDHPTSDWAGPQNFKAIANFHRCFEKFGTSASKWAMGKASSFDIVRLAATWNFFAEYHQKLPKTENFCFSANYLRFWYWNTYPGYHHVKAHVQTFPKMW